MAEIEITDRQIASLNQPNGMGLEIEPSIPYEEWASLGKKLAHIGKVWQFWVGDWLLFGQAKWGEKYAQAASDTGLSPQTLKNCQWVASRIQKSLRRDLLSWSHHEVVAALDGKDMAKALDMAEKEGWTVKRLKESLRILDKKRETGTGECEECGGETLHFLLDSGSIIVLDPCIPVYEVEGRRARRSKTAFADHDAVCGKVSRIKSS